MWRPRAAAAGASNTSILGGLLCGRGARADRPFIFYPRLSDDLRAPQQLGYCAFVMGGHGGLNILPQKSWNVYSARNRARVAADEAQAEIDAANARVAEAAEIARQNLQTLRARAAATAGEQEAPSVVPAHPPGHVNFFNDLEAAERTAEREAARKREDARLVSKIMPDLDLSKSSREPAPWYTLAPESDGVDAQQRQHAPTAPPAPPAPAMLPAEPHEKERKGRRRHRDRSSDDEAERKHHRHHRHHKHRKRRHEHDRRRERSDDSRSPDRPITSTTSVDREALARMREERLARERREQQRSIQQWPGGGPTNASAGHDAALRAKFLALTGEQQSGARSNTTRQVSSMRGRA